MIELEKLPDKDEHRMVNALLDSLLAAGWKPKYERADIRYRDGFVALRAALREAPQPPVFGITEEGE